MPIFKTSNKCVTNFKFLHGGIFNLHFIMLLFIRLGYFLAWLFGKRSDLFCEGHLNVDVDMYEASFEVIVSLQMPYFL